MSEMLSLNAPNEIFLPSFREAVRLEDFSVPKDAKSFLDTDSKRFLDWFAQEARGEGGPLTLPDGTLTNRVPQETLWLTQNTTFIGAFRLRTRLTPALENHGGHVGYEVRPSWRGRGMATKGMTFIKIQAHKVHMLKKLLLTCAPDNMASQHVILNSGGVYHDTLDNPNGYGPTMRFWMDTFV